MAKIPAPALVLCSVVSIQFGQATGKHLFGAGGGGGSVGPLGVAALRLGLAALLLLLLHRRTLGSASAHGSGDVWTVLGLGTAIAGMNLIYPAMHHLPLGLATALQLLGPLTLALLTSRRPADLLCALGAGLGVWLFHAPSGTAFPVAGVLPALASGASMAAYLRLSRRAGAHGTGGSPLAPAVAWAALLTVPFGAAESGTALLAPRVLLTGLLVAVGSAVLPYSLELSALRTLPPRTVGVLQSLEPPTAGLAGTVVLGELLHPAQWCALGCIGAASAGAVVGTARRTQSPAPPQPPQPPQPQPQPRTPRIQDD